MSAKVKRYHPALTTLHWLLAIAIFLAIGFGGLVLDSMSNANIHKPGLLRMHIALGALILLFTILRLAIRVRTPRPAAIASGNALMDKLAVGIQHLLYVLTIMVALAGLTLAFSVNLFAVLYQHTGRLPANFENYFAHTVHGLLAYALLAAVALHVAGALKNQFILKNGIFSRLSLRGED